jgi:hypothetical protein
MCASPMTIQGSSWTLQTSDFRFSGWSLEKGAKLCLAPGCITRIYKCAKWCQAETGAKPEVGGQRYEKVAFCSFRKATSIAVFTI